MKRKLELIKSEAEETISFYAQRNKKNAEFDRMAASNWNLAVYKEGIRKTVSPAPANAIQTSVKVLGAETPKLKYTPVGPHPDDRATASKIERGLLWELKSASKRSPTKLVPDIIRSALQYAECAVYVDYLPWRLKGKVSDARMKRILRSGNFALIPHNPSSVYPRYSQLGLESVLLCKEMRASQVVQYWGDYASFLKDSITDSDPVVTMYDYVDYDQRAVWLSSPKDGKGKAAEFTIIDEQRERSFLPWAIRMTGTSLESVPELQRTPFLNTVLQANMWDDLNLMQTLVNSEVLSYASAPRYAIYGPNGDLVKVDYGDINKPMQIPPGHEVKQLAPHPIDNALLEIMDRTKANLDAATNVQILSNLNFPAGTAYATVNAVLQTAIASLQPYKVLAEMNLADIFETMLLWIDETDGEIAAYGSGKSNSGEQYTITKEDFSPNAIYIDVELNASAPTDFMQRINAGTLMYQLGYPKSRVFEDLNVADPEQVIRERYQEDFLDNEMALRMQQRQMEAQQEAQQAPNLQNMQQGPPPSPGFENVQGQGFDPNMGGTPPQLAASGLTREELNGVTSGGDPIAEI